ncbi:MAG: RtcB family protein [Planctomycetota bacterium]
MGGDVSGKDLKKRGWPPGPLFKLAIEAANTARTQKVVRGKKEALERLDDVIQKPHEFADDAVFGALANQILDDKGRSKEAKLADTPIEYAIWGEDGMDEQTLSQMENACRLPITAAAAQMPDGHVGYGLPIGGVVGVRNAVIPYGVGVDIACRVRLSVIDLDAARIEGMRGMLVNSLCEETAFGMGAKFKGNELRQHEVMEDPAWDELPGDLKRLKEKAWSQLGSSGSGNHFVEWGEFVVERKDADTGNLAPGRYLALLSHSGSRGFGALTADHYTKVAMSRTKLPYPQRHLAWLDLDSADGQEYWLAMNLAGRYAHANHECIHREVLKNAGFKAAVVFENHHNFAWKEEHNGEELIVHRKGATPAAKGELGVIPGTMADPGFIVRGKGNASSLNSAAHGAGRRMSRKKAKETLTKHDMADYLKKRNVQLLSAGLDESPRAYKNIREVMAYQADLVEVIAEFHPRIVRMADDGTSED